MKAGSLIGAEGVWRLQCAKGVGVSRPMSCLSVAQWYSSRLMAPVVNLPLQDSYQNYSRVDKKGKESRKGNGKDQKTIGSPRAQSVRLGRKASKKPPGTEWMLWLWWLWCTSPLQLGGFRKSAQ